jgi:hypothetical protein
MAQPFRLPIGTESAFAEPDRGRKEEWGLTSNYLTFGPPEQRGERRRSSAARRTIAF